MRSHIRTHFTKPGSVLCGLLSILVSAVLVGLSYGQALPKKINPYSPSPTRASAEPSPTERSEVVVNNDDPRKAESASTDPTQIYRVGAGDVLSVNLPDSGRTPGYYTVKPDGTIDFPLAGGELSVAGQTVNQIASVVSSRITIYPNARIDVRVREYASHRISVAGMVERPGDKYLQREAIPLFVIQAESGVDPKATRVIITRGTAGPKETINLKDVLPDNSVIYPGNSVEFVDENSASAASHYYISGEVASAGQKSLGTMQTLYQAVAAAGGTKGAPKKAVIRRRDSGGKLTSVEHKLKSIKEGKAPDPEIFAGDVIEILK